MLFTNFVCLLYLMVLCNGHTISKSIDDDEHIDAYQDSITDLDPTAHYKAKQYPQHRHRIPKRTTQQTYASQEARPLLEPSKSNAKTIQKSPTDHGKCKSQTRKQGGFWRKFKGKEKIAKYTTGNKYRFKENDLPELTEYGWWRQPAGKPALNAHDYMKYQRKNRHSFVLRQPDVSRRKSATCRANITQLKRINAMPAAVALHPIAKSTVTSKVYPPSKNTYTLPAYVAVNHSDALGGLTNYLDNLERLYNIGSYSTLINRVFTTPMRIASATITTTEYPGTAHLEEALDDIKRKAISMISIKTPFFTETSPSTTHKARPMNKLRHNLIRSRTFFIHKQSVRNKRSKRSHQGLTTNVSTLSFPYPYIATNNFKQERICNTMDSMQSEIKKIYNKIKCKLSTSTTQAKTKIKQATNRIRNITSTTAHRIHNKQHKTSDTKQKDPKMNHKKTTKILSWRPENSAIDAKVLKKAPTQSIASAQDNIDSMDSATTTHSVGHRKTTKRDYTKADKLNITSTAESTYLTYDDKGAANDLNYSDTLLNSAEKLYRSKAMSPVSQSNLQKISDKLSYDNYVNGFRHYLNFQKEEAHQNFSKMVKYQAHKHHRVDDIGKFILEKIPKMPRKSISLQERSNTFFDDSDDDDHDMSTKSDDSWFRKHFYVFIDKGPPKKYHTSQTVSLKSPVGDMDSRYLFRNTRNNKHRPESNDEVFIQIGDNADASFKATRSGMEYTGVNLDDALIGLAGDSSLVGPEYLKTNKIKYAVTKASHDDVESCIKKIKAMLFRHDNKLLVNKLNEQKNRVKRTNYQNDFPEVTNFNKVVKTTKRRKGEMKKKTDAETAAYVDPSYIDTEKAKQKVVTTCTKKSIFKQLCKKFGFRRKTKKKQSKEKRSVPNRPPRFNPLQKIMDIFKNKEDENPTWQKETKAPYKDIDMSIPIKFEPHDQNIKIPDVKDVFDFNNDGSPVTKNTPTSSQTTAKTSFRFEDFDYNSNVSPIRTTPSISTKSTTKKETAFSFTDSTAQMIEEDFKNNMTIDDETSKATTKSPRFKSDQDDKDLISVNIQTVLNMRTKSNSQITDKIILDLEENTQDTQLSAAEPYIAQEPKDSTITPTDKEITTFLLNELSALPTMVTISKSTVTNSEQNNKIDWTSNTELASTTGQENLNLLSFNLKPKFEKAKLIKKHKTTTSKRNTEETPTSIAQLEEQLHKSQVQEPKHKISSTPKLEQQMNLEYSSFVNQKLNKKLGENDFKVPVNDAQFMGNLNEYLYETTDATNSNIGNELELMKTSAIWKTESDNHLSLNDDTSWRKFLSELENTSSFPITDAAYDHTAPNIANTKSDIERPHTPTLNVTIHTPDSLNAITSNHASTTDSGFLFKLEEVVFYYNIHDRPNRKMNHSSKAMSLHTSFARTEKPYNSTSYKIRDNLQDIAKTRNRNCTLASPTVMAWAAFKMPVNMFKWVQYITPSKAQSKIASSKSDDTVRWSRDEMPVTQLENLSDNNLTRTTNISKLKHLHKQHNWIGKSKHNMRMNSNGKKHTSKFVKTLAFRDSDSLLDATASVMKNTGHKGTLSKTTKIPASDIGLTQFDPNVTPVMVDTTLLSYDDDVNSIMKEYSLKKPLSVMGDQYLTKLKSKLQDVPEHAVTTFNEQPKHYFSTPLPMTPQAFDEFLKEHGIDVASVTIPVHDMQGIMHKHYIPHITGNPAIDAFKLTNPFTTKWTTTKFRFTEKPAKTAKSTTAKETIKLTDLLTPKVNKKRARRRKPHINRYKRVINLYKVFTTTKDKNEKNDKSDKMTTNSRNSEIFLDPMLYDSKPSSKDNDDIELTIIDIDGPNNNSKFQMISTKRKSFEPIFETKAYTNAPAKITSTKAQEPEKIAPKPNNANRSNNVSVRPYKLDSNTKSQLDKYLQGYHQNDDSKWLQITGYHCKCDVYMLDDDTKATANMSETTLDNMNELSLRTTTSQLENSQTQTTQILNAITSTPAPTSAYYGNFNSVQFARLFKQLERLTCRKNNSYTTTTATTAIDLKKFMLDILNTTMKLDNSGAKMEKKKQQKTTMITEKTHKTTKIQTTYKILEPGSNIKTGRHKETKEDKEVKEEEERKEAKEAKLPVANTRPELKISKTPPTKASLVQSTITNTPQSTTLSVQLKISNKTTMPESESTQSKLYNIPYMTTPMVSKASDFRNGDAEVSLRKMALYVEPEVTLDEQTYNGAVLCEDTLTTHNIDKENHQLVDSMLNDINVTSSNTNDVEESFMKRKARSHDTYNVKNVAALEVIVDLVRNTLSYEEKDIAGALSNSLLLDRNVINSTTSKRSFNSTNAIQVHIAIPLEGQNAQKRSLKDPERVRKVFSAKMSSPVDIEYQVHSFESADGTGFMHINAKSNCSSKATTTSIPLGTAISSETTKTTKAHCSKTIACSKTASVVSIPSISKSCVTSETGMSSSYTSNKVSEEERLSPGMYLLIETPSSGYALKPVKAKSDIPEKKYRQLITLANANEYKEETKRPENIKNIAKVTLSKNFVAAVNKRLVELYDNLSKINLDASLREKRNFNFLTTPVVPDYEKSLVRVKKSINWDAITKYLGNDRVCTCKCIENKPMCRPCAASDAVMDELIFELDSLGQYMKDHCTEIQTYFWMNPSGGLKLRDAVHRIDRSLHDYYRRVKGKCQGRTCKTLDKRQLIKNVNVVKNGVVSLLMNDLLAVADDLNRTIALQACFNHKLKEAGENMLSAISSCITRKSIKKRSDTEGNNKKKFNKNMYSLDNINVNIICHPREPDTDKTKMKITTNATCSTLPEITTMVDDILFLPTVPTVKKKKSKVFKFFPHKNIKSKLFTYYTIPDKTPKIFWKRDNTYQTFTSSFDRKDEAPWNSKPKNNKWQKTIYLAPAYSVAAQPKQFTEKLELKNKNDINLSPMYMRVDPHIFIKNKKPKHVKVINFDQFVQLYNSLEDMEKINMHSNRSRFLSPFKTAKILTTMPTTLSTTISTAENITAPDATKQTKVLKTTSKRKSIKMIEKTPVENLAEPSVKHNLGAILDEIEKKVEAVNVNYTFDGPDYESKEMLQSTDSMSPDIKEEPTANEYPFMPAEKQMSAEESSLTAQAKSKASSPFNDPSETSNKSPPKHLLVWALSNDLLPTSSSSSNLMLSMEKTNYLKPEGKTNGARTKVSTQSTRSKSLTIQSQSRLPTTQAHFAQQLKAATLKFFGLKKIDIPEDVEIQLPRQPPLAGVKLVGTTGNSKLSLLYLDRDTNDSYVNQQRSDPTILIVNKYEDRLPGVTVSENEKNYIKSLQSAMQYEINRLTRQRKNTSNSGTELHNKQIKQIHVENTSGIPMTIQLSVIQDNVTKLHEHFTKPHKSTTSSKKISTKHGQLTKVEATNKETIASLEIKPDKSTKKPAKKIGLLTRLLSKISEKNNTHTEHKKNKKQKEKEKASETCRRNSVCDLDATFRRIKQLRTKLVEKAYEAYVRNVPCYKYHRLKKSFLIKCKNGHTKWDWIRNKRFLVKTNNRFYHEQYYDEYETFVKDEHSVYRIQNRRKRYTLNNSSSIYSSTSPPQSNKNELYVMVGDSTVLVCQAKPLKYHLGWGHSLNSAPPLPVLSVLSSHSQHPFTWEADRQDMLDMENVLVEGRTLQILNAVPNNAGQYSCSLGDEIQQVIELKVVKLPAYNLVFAPTYWIREECNYDDLTAMQLLGRIMSKKAGCGHVCSIRTDNPTCERHTTTNHTIIRSRAVLTMYPPQVECSVHCRRDILSSLIRLASGNVPALTNNTVVLYKGYTNETLQPCRHIGKSVITHALKKKDSSGFGVDYEKLPSASSIQPGQSLLVIVCHAGFYLLQDQNICAPCPANTSSAAGATRCAPCPRGTAAAPGAPACEPAGADQRARRYDWWWCPPCGYALAGACVVVACGMCVALALLVHTCSGADVCRERTLIDYSPPRDVRCSAVKTQLCHSHKRPTLTTRVQAWCPLSPSRVILPRLFKPSLHSTRGTGRDLQETRFEQWKEQNMPPPLPSIDFETDS